jgi:hypothetical protein
MEVETPLDPKAAVALAAVMELANPTDIWALEDRAGYPAWRERSAAGPMLLTR